MDSPPPSPSSESPYSNLKNVVPVIVAGLRDNKDDTVEYYPWEDYWMDRLGIPDFPEIITFDPGFNDSSQALSLLSPSWCDEQARMFLDEVKSKREETSQGKESQLVFFGEDLGGIILKQALIIAGSEDQYSELLRDACACVLFGVPHRVPSPELWSQHLVATVFPFWSTLPKWFWSSVASLRDYCQQIATQFADVAFQMTLVTIFDGYGPDSLPAAEAICILGLAHERVVPYSSWSKHVAKFDDLDGGAVSPIFDNLNKAASVRPDFRKYMRELCSRSSLTPLNLPERSPSMVSAIQEILHQSDKMVSVVIIGGSDGTGKSELLVHLYRRLLLRHRTENSIAYFSFEAWDHRQQSVSTMLVKIIQQLLACEPQLLSLLPKTMSNNDETRWAEGNLWVQLRFIIHQSTSPYIYLLVDSLVENSTFINVKLVHALFSLRFVAPDRLKIVCTGIPATVISKQTEVVFITMDDRSEYREDLEDYHRKLVEKLVTESPKFSPVKAKVEACLGKSNNFLHSNLLAHRIGAIRGLSYSSYIEEALDRLAIGCVGTIEAMVSSAPLWVHTVISCMIMARRPLRSIELGVAFVLAGNSQLGALKSATEFDERKVPLDIQGDLARFLGTLVCSEGEEMRISHSYIEKVLRKWLDRTGKSIASHELRLTETLMNYMQLCLRKLEAGDKEDIANQPSEDKKDYPDEPTEVSKDIPDEPTFGLFEYCLDNWHAHYRNVMDEVARPLASQSIEARLEDLVLSLLRSAAYLPWLQPNDMYTSKLQKRARRTDSTLDAIQLAARFGLITVLGVLMNESEDLEMKQKSSQVCAFQLACQHGHQKVVEYLVDRLSEVEIEAQLARACQHGEETTVILLLDRYKNIRDPVEILQRLLPEVCRMGHLRLAKEFFQRGATVKERAEDADNYKIPLHEAVDQGHFEVVELLLDKGANAMTLFVDKSTPLLHSVERGYILISDRLLNEPSIQDTPNEAGLTALGLAARRGDVDLIEKLLRVEVTAGGLEGRSPKNTILPLHEAASHGHLHAVEMLLKRSPPSLNALNTEGQSALFLALRNNQIRIVQYLLDQEDVNISFSNVYAESTLKQAIIHSNVSATVALLNLPGANVKRYEDEQSSLNSSPLTDAAWKDCDEIFQALLDAGANTWSTVDPKLKSEDEILDESPGGGWTAAHFAAHYGSKKVMQLIVTDNVELVKIKTSAGHTPLHLAAAKDHDDIVEIMLPGAKLAAGVLTKLSSKSKISTFDPPSKVETETTSRDEPKVTSVNSEAEPYRPPRFDLDAQTDDGFTALHISIAIGSIDLIKMLVKSGADPNIRDSEGKTALHFAASAANSATDMLNVLLQSVKGKTKVDINRWDSEEKTPLYYAVDSSNEAAVRVLLRHGADPDLVSQDGFSPLHIAAASGSTDIVKLLLDHRADLATPTYGRGLTPLHTAVSSGHMETVKLLLDCVSDINLVDARGDTPLHEASRQGNSLMVSLLLEAEANYNAANERLITPLQRAVLNGHSDAASILLKAGSDPDLRDEDGDTALTVALRSGDSKLVKELLEYGADYEVINGAEITPLMLALGSPKDMLPLLINKKADVQKCGPRGITALHRAAGDALNHEIQYIIQLLKYGKEYLDIRDYEQQTPIHHAAKSGRGGMLDALQGQGADITARDAQGRTAMHHAAQSMVAQEFEKAFKDFLRPIHQNQVNIPDKDGWTPLHWACKGGSDAIVKLLLDNCGTVIDKRKMVLQGKYGWTALAVAEFHDRSEIAQLIVNSLEVSETTTPEGEFERAWRTIPEEHGGMPPPVPKLRRLRPVKVGYRNWFVTCDDCLHVHMTGARWKCIQHLDFDLCFKCYWHHEDTHYPPFHDFNQESEGPHYGPEFVDPLPNSLLSVAPEPGSPIKPGLSRQPTVDLTDHIANPEVYEEWSLKPKTKPKRRTRLGLFRSSFMMDDIEGSITSPKTEEDQRRPSVAEGNEMDKSLSETEVEIA